MTARSIGGHIHLGGGFTPEEKAKIRTVIKDAYENSASAKAMFNRLGVSEPDLTIKKGDGFHGNPDTNVVTIDLGNYLTDRTVIDAHGKAVNYTLQFALLHEISHALNNLHDPTPQQLAAHDYVGDNVRYENLMRDELGKDARTSYYNIMKNNEFADRQPGFDNGYTHGAKIDLGVISNHTTGAVIDTTSLGSSSDLLIGGSVANNMFTSGAGVDFLYGFKGLDKLDGGDGDDFLFGGDDNDILIAGTGSNTLDGGTGKDLAELTGFKFTNTLTVAGDTRTFVNQITGEQNVLKNVETVRFTASSLPLPTAITSTFVAPDSATTLVQNDDGSQEASLTQAFEKGFKFFGTKYTSVFVNNNGNLTFGGALSGYTPGTIGGNSGLPIIAAFWADVDTRGGGGTVSYGYNASHDSFVATWSNVDYFNATATDHASLKNSYQIEIFDQGAGDAEIVIRYGDLNWTTGDASGGSGGHGGTVARAGVNSGNAAFQYEMPGSGTEAAMLSLNATSNCDRAGVWRFSVHNGTIIEDAGAPDAHHSVDMDWAIL